jgi:DNA-3-methyladenine glycosylase II
MQKFTFSIQPQGPFSLAASKQFIEGFPAAPALATVGASMRVAFCSEGSFCPGLASLTQRERHGVVSVAVQAIAAVDQGLLQKQITRMFSLDVDGRDFSAVGQRDPIIAGLQHKLDMLRPVLFPSPYEAAVWAVLSQRVSMKQAASIKAKLSAAHGTEIPVAAGHSVRIIPTPDRLLMLAGFAGIPDVKWQRLQAVADAAKSGVLDGERLRAMPADVALASLQTISGIGPFSAELVLIRGAGAPDVAPTAEARIHAIVEQRYRLSVAEASRLWSPLRSWCSLLLRVGASDDQGSCGATTELAS